MKFARVATLAVLVAMALMLSGCDNPFSGGKKVAKKIKAKVIEKTLKDMAVNKVIELEGPIGDYVMEYCKHGENYQMHNITDHIWWPGCDRVLTSMKDFEPKSKGGVCPEDACMTPDMAKEMDDFNDKYGGKRVTYKSRAGKDENGDDIDVIELTGWWLPAPNADKSTPRIVLQHGFTSNSNKYRTQFMAYLLRKAGFSVLVNNLRDHCYSGKTKEKTVGWGAAYPMDILGAWDFAKDGVAEPIDKSQVGMMGFSMGGFTVLNAFGRAGEVPGLWVDGPPMTPKAGFSQGMYIFLKDELPIDVSQLHGPLMDDLWKMVEEEAKNRGVDLNGMLPEKELPKGPNTKRPIFVTANHGDETVNFRNAKQLIGWLEGMPKQYDLKEFWDIKDKDCSGNAHCNDMLTSTEDYAAKLKKFWTDVFAQDKSSDEKSSDEKLRLYTQQENKPVKAALLPSIGAIVGAFASVVAIVLAVVARRAYVSRQHADGKEVEDGLE